MNFQLTFSVQFSQFNEAQVGQISVKSLEHLAVSRYLSPDLTVPGSLAPGLCVLMQSYIHLFYPEICGHIRTQGNCDMDNHSSFLVTVLIAHVADMRPCHYWHCVRLGLLFTNL